MKGMKFKVDNEAQSRLLQAALFVEGYSWITSEGLDKEPKHVSSKYLFASEDGYLTQASHTETFNNSSYEWRGTMEYIYKSRKPSPSLNKQVVLVEVLGKMYDKKELEAILSNLTQYSVEK